MSRKKTKKKKQQKIEFSPQTKGIFLLAFSLTMLLSLLSFAYGEKTPNWLGTIGFSLGWTITALFGLSGYLVCFYLGWMGTRRIFNKPINNPLYKHFTVAVMVLSLGMLLSVAEDAFPVFADWVRKFFYTQLWTHNLQFHIGGAPLYFLYRDLPVYNLARILNTTGVLLVFMSAFFVSLLLLTKTTLSQCLDVLSLLWSKVAGSMKKSIAPLHDVQDLQRFVKVKIPNFSLTSSAKEAGEKTAPLSELLAIRPEKNLLERPSLSRKGAADLPSLLSAPEEPLKISNLAVPAKRTPERKQKREFAPQNSGNLGDYKIPALSLLSSPKKVDQSSLKKDLRRYAEVLEETLHSFGIDAKVGQINCGPTITAFEVHPAIGVKVQKIKTLEDDIALNMEARSIRIQAPIPGKAAIGIEVPNPQPQEVAFKDMLSAYLQSGKKFHIPVLLGKTVTGDYVMEDLNKMPHVIIAGATGSGKSVCINTVVMSILMTAKPDEVKLIMVDPKKVELTPYSKLPHMLAPVITEPAGAAAAMSWLVKEMESRYETLKAVGFRNIASFNSRTINRDFEASLDKEIPEKMHYIVCIIDELADLMMVSGNDIETYIARIAQMARAVGIHLILATQRPSREVITGLIKANFPTRISFKVSSRINSQIILDETGAESLLGNGDMLFLPPGSHHLIRAQGAFIRDEDINAVVDSICRQAPVNYMIKSFDEMGEIDVGARQTPDNDSDALYDQACQLVVSAKVASTTFLQRKLKVGYARAAKLIDMLEANGIVGPADGSKPRKIISALDEALDDLIEE